MRRTGSWTPAFDYILALLGIFLILAITEKPTTTPMRIDTLGVLAVTARWPGGSNDDVDLWTQDPTGKIAWYGGLTEGLMTLGGDDLGTLSTGTQDVNGNVITSRDNGERTIIKGAVPGEYTVNVNMYKKNDKGPTPVTVELWQLRGADRVLISKKIILVREAQEVTAFRFTLDRSGDASNFNTLPKSLVGLLR